MSKKLVPIEILQEAQLGDCVLEYFARKYAIKYGYIEVIGVSNRHLKNVYVANKNVRDLAKEYGLGCSPVHNKDIIGSYVEALIYRLFLQNKIASIRLIIFIINQEFIDDF